MSTAGKDNIGTIQQSLTTTTTTTNAASGGGGGSGSPAGSKAISTTNWFTTEIQQMMYGFGDCRRSLHESAVLVEEIVHQQMASLLCHASDVAIMRGSRFVGMEDILFLMRKDKVKLRRLLRFLELKDFKVATLKGAGLDEEDANDLGDTKPQMLKRRRKICYDFLASIDQTGELLAQFDDQGIDMVKHERLVRAELMARGMDPQQYKEFCEARQANFSRRYKSQRFKDWLMAGVNVDIKPNPQALEVISYLAYETVAQVVDLALVVKQDMRAVVSDPLSRFLAPVQHNYHDLQSSMLFPSATRPALGGLASPARSPPTTPTPPASGQANPPTPGASSNTSSGSSGQSGVGSSPSQLSSNNLSRVNKKKRKRSGPPTTLDTSWNQAILPSDIREAMRRYFQDIGPFASMTKIRNPFIPRTRLLCT
ncbi:transcription initiation protein SPT3 homolog isoform X1 [Pomacea canaliculata]|uniref:transcription initiation protein SPT3 homolog isoform X1 n=2 Tax=Pomacea canaliculata TaxID=400727 RepID=UPI000D72CE9D|nr:transcription initiation protein SPT3 homolog isoform X1 [Pomacea canaliculata]